MPFKDNVTAGSNITTMTVGNKGEGNSFAERHRSLRDEVRNALDEVEGITDGLETNKANKSVTDDHETRIGALETVFDDVSNTAFMGLKASDNGSSFDYTRLGQAIGKSVTEEIITSGKKYITGFDSLPIYKDIKRVILDNEGNEIYEEGEAGYDDTLSSGGLAAYTHAVMVRIPKFYYSMQVVESPYSVTLKLSDTKIEGMEVHPAFLDVDQNGNIVERNVKYISAFEATLINSAGNYRFSDKTDYSDRVAEDFRLNQGGINYTATDLLSSANKSNLQCPFTEGSLSEYRVMAENRGFATSQQSCKWKQLQWWDMQMINMLFAVEFGTFQWQQYFTGVTALPGGSYNESVSTGLTHDLGSNSGYMDKTAQRAGASYSVAVPSYRGIENPFGNIWKFIEGIKTEHGTDSNTGKIKVGIYNHLSVNNYADYDENGFEKNIEVDPQRNGSGYFKYISPAANSFLPGGETNGGSASYFDYNWRDVTGDGEIALSGGSWDNGSYAGGFALHLNDSFSLRHRLIGGRFSL